jgi:hypothetical protein
LGVTSDASEEYREGFSDTNKKNKLQNPSENCETNLMILINPSLAHIGTIALMDNHGLIMLKNLSQDFTENCTISFSFVYI